MLRLTIPLPLAAAFSLLALGACAQQQAATPAKPAEAAQVGRWVTESGNLEVDIAPCGQALCGTVAKVIDNKSMSDPSKSMADGPSPLGMKILTDFVPTTAGEWQGQIFNRENGKTYDCLMSVSAPDQLKLHAYVGTPMMGKSQIWRRVAATDRK